MAHRQICLAADPGAMWRSWRKSCWCPEHREWPPCFCLAKCIDGNTYPQKREPWPSHSAVIFWKMKQYIILGFWIQIITSSFSSLIQSCPTNCNPMHCSTPGFPVHHQLPELAQTHVHGVGDAIQPSHPLSSLSPPAFNLSQHQDFFHWVSSSHQVAKVLEFQLQHQSFQWMFRTDFL